MIVGALLVTGSVVMGLGPIAFVCGALTLWTGIVKVIVLRIWRTTLSAEPVPEGVHHTGGSDSAVRQGS
jgi:hypothetical protein